MTDNKLEKRLAELEEKVRRLETKNRGYLNQKLAAEHIGRSSETRCGPQGHIREGKGEALVKWFIWSAP